VRLTALGVFRLLKPALFEFILRRHCERRNSETSRLAVSMKGGETGSTNMKAVVRFWSLERGVVHPEKVPLGGMKMFRKALIGMAVVALVGFVSAAFAAEAPGGAPGQPREMTITGKVTAAAADAKYAATVEGEREMRGEMRKFTFQVTNDEQGKKLAKEANGKTAEIKGTVERKETERWLTVKEFKIVEEKPAAK
jgi:hypothetical protein